MSLRSVGLALVLLGLAPALAGAHAVAGVSEDEARLRAFEAQQLGAEHAAAHARQRELAANPPPSVPRRAAAAPPVPADPPGEVGSWQAAQPLPVIAINSILLVTGKVLMFAYPARPPYGPSDYAVAYVWDPVTGTSTEVPPPIDPDTGKATNIWCGGASLLADGRVLVTGGNVDDPRTDFHGIDRVFTFDPFTERWETQPRMAQGRWYPTQLLMPNGRTLIFGGLTRPGDRDNAGTNLDLEVFYPEGKIRLFGDMRFGDVGQPPAPALYPKMFWMPDGRAFIAGPQRVDTWFLDMPKYPEPTTWSDAPDLSVMREWGTTVMLDGGRILSLGGSDGDTDDDGRRPAMGTTEVFDPAQPAAGWTTGPPMAAARSHANSVLLPDGTVATIGGGYGEDDNQQFYRWLYTEDQTRVELFDPKANTVRLGPAQAEGRTYHSTALLLPDGSVMSAGDDINGPNGTPTELDSSGATSDTAEIYEPAYLHRGPRPVIKSAPDVVEYGSSFSVVTPDAAAIARVVLMAPGSATHATDMSQRRVDLGAPVKYADGIRVNAPSSLDAAPPGYYMMFLLNGDGVPSKARWVKLPLPPQPPEREPTPVPTPTKTPTATPTATPAATKPRLRIRITPRRLRTLKRTRRLRVAVRLDRRGYVRVAGSIALDSKRSRGLARTRSVRFRSKGARAVTLRVSARALRILSRRKRVTLRVRASAKTARSTVRATSRRRVR